MWQFADNQPACPQGTQEEGKKAEDAGSEGFLERFEAEGQDGERSPAAAWSVHARMGPDAEEAELSASQGGARQALQP